MKKFISTATVIALIAMIPAVFVGYLNNRTTTASKPDTEIVSDVANSRNEGFIIHLVKTF